MNKGRLIILAGFAVVVTALVALCPMPSALALKQEDPINYEDPNMAVTASYVAEASNVCIRQNGETGGNVAECMNGLAKTPTEQVVPISKTTARKSKN